MFFNIKFIPKLRYSRTDFFILNRYITIIFFLFSQLVSAQQVELVEININASVLDNETKKPIPFSEIKFLKKNIGTISDNDGRFNLSYFDGYLNENDVFQISAYGYDTIRTNPKNLYKFLKNTNNFFLKKNKSSKKWFSEDDNSGKYLFGKVFSVKGPIQGASIKIKNRLIESKSNFEGFFKIKADLNDIINISYLGMIDEQLLIEDYNDKYVLLKTDNQILDQVVITGSKELSEEVETSYGTKKKKSVGFSTSTITSKDISPGAVSIVDAIRGKFTNVQIAYNQSGAATGNKVQIYVRGGTLSINNSAAAIYDIEGLVYTDVPDFIDPQQIESITLLRSLGATNRYGSQGRGGVFLIKLKSSSKNIRKLLKSLEVKGNDYNEPLYLVDIDSLKPNFIDEFKNVSSVINAKKRFFKLQKEFYESSIPFYIESYNYFKNLDEEFALSVLKILSEKAKDNPKALKTIAYKLEESGNYNLAKVIYQRLLKIRPSDEQSYRDLALIYKQIGEYQFSSSIYNKILKNQLKNVDILGLQKTVVNEASHLYWTQKDNLLLSEFPLKILRGFIPKNDWKKYGFDYRIVFDWNDPAVEFNIQFVDPNKKYFNWSHTIIDDKTALEDEFNYGYNTEEFIIEKSKKGEWIINIENYTIQDSSNPTFIKYTVYKNYGRPNEIKKVKVLDLNKLKQKITLDILKYYN